MPRRMLSALRGGLRTLANRTRSTLGWGNYWFWLPPLEHEVAVASLVYPFRYDILIRRDFFGLYAANRQLHRSDPAGFLALARSHPYFQWFEKARIGPLHPELSGDESAISRMFEERVRTALELYDRIERDGFDPGFPIAPDTGLEILPTATGLRTGARYYMGDGCHRLACLMALGHRSLPPAWVRVKCHRRLVPLDVTALLAPHVPIEWPADFVAEAESATPNAAPRSGDPA